MVNAWSILFMYEYSVVMCGAVYGQCRINGIKNIHMRKDSLHTCVWSI